MRATVVGGGSWGTALAKVLADRGHQVTQWFRNPDRAAAVEKARENEIFLPGVRLPDNVHTTADLSEALSASSTVVVVTPSHAVREVMSRAADLIPEEAIVVSASKGVERGSFKTMAAVLGEILPRHRARIAVLSGPSFAREVATDRPTAVTAAAEDAGIAREVQDAFTTPTFRVYTSTDVTGVELGAAVKNVIAIAAGVCDGMELGHSTRAALITRGLAETARLAARLGADPRTLSGLSGLGDLVVTCTGDLSRNRSVGLRLGRGEPLSQIMSGMTMVAEGVRNTRSINELAQSLDVDMPITDQVFRLLYEGKSPSRVVRDLMTRQLRPEMDD